MMNALLSFSIAFALVSVSAAMLLCTLRLLIGPAAQDRVLALDTLWMCVMMLALVLGIRFSNQTYFEVALLIALIGFVSSIALAKFLMRGEVIE
ncbi:MAG TPA: K+/H+ antiporter subunit F [Azoarcus sp.]|nr:K+/H+ antiporter subunit F [Azoarcus sp.]